ncbi:succinylglutamate desuccinylase/aspartoacylase family protein [Paucibacter soli]|uniref:succinylglutamate desuccinylase/aspartoacylase family protein n=1 Tax=Paucibacter soli TaxID=3133433 RepID=UPI0030A4D2B7
MHMQRHALLPATPGLSHELISLHYGQPGHGLKASIQAALHADEVPGMLVAQHLRELLDELEAAGRIAGEIVLVPAANPLGMSQWQLRGMQGRFEFYSGENFNRHYADLAEPVARRLEGRLGPDPLANVRLVRAALREAVAALPAGTVLASLRRTLLGLAIDADIVLDLHCDGEALLHFYTAEALWPEAKLLGRCLGAELALLADASGDDPFDEACSMVWARLRARLAPSADKPLPLACLAATIELRGEADVQHQLARRDAQAIVHYLAERGLISGAVAQLPEQACEGLPLAGSMPLVAPQGGVLVFLREVGARLRAGEPVAELIDPISGQRSIVTSPIDGLFFARENRRMAVPGMRLGKVAGRQPLRAGKLLST